MVSEINEDGDEAAAEAGLSLYSFLDAPDDQVEQEKELPPHVNHPFFLLSQVCYLQEQKNREEQAQV
jgi:hypothetical protein